MPRSPITYAGSTPDPGLAGAPSNWAERGRAIAHEPGDYVAIFDNQGVYLYMNQTTEGMRIEDLVGKVSAFDFVDPLDYETMCAAFRRAFGEGKGSTYDVYVPTLDHWFSNQATPLWHDGRVVALAMVTRDITEARCSEDAKRTRERHLQLALAGADLGTFSFDLSSGHWELSPRLCRMWGLEPDSPQIPQNIEHFYALLHADDLSHVKQAMRRALDTGEFIEVEFRVRRATGEYLWVQGRARLFKEAQGYAHVCGIIADISARRRAEEEHELTQAHLRHVQKMDTLGTLAGGIAHDFNNFLSPILGNAELLQHAIRPESPLRASVDDIVTAALRAQELVGRILLFGRARDAKFAQVDVAEVAREALRLVSPSVPPTVAVTADIEPSVALVRGSTGEIHQALTNLCTNAYQALAGRAGHLTVTVKNAVLEAPFAAAHGLCAGPAVRVVVEDDGPGIPEHIQSRLFDPFFTTKGVGEGVGLGLAIVHSVVTRHQGAVLVHSAVGSGTAFELYFPAAPRADERADEPGCARNEPAASIGVCPPVRVLCVDDDAAVLRTLEAMLRLQHHSVVACTSPVQALAKVRTDPYAFDLVITDQTMPQLSGVELAEALLLLRPELPVALVSGYANMPALPSNVAILLQKPVSLDALGNALSRLVGEVIPPAQGLRLSH